MDIAAVFAWVHQNDVVPWLFILLIVREVSTTVRFLYAKRQERIQHVSHDAVTLSNNRLAEKQLEREQTGGRQERV